MANFQAGDLALLIDAKGRRKIITLQPDEKYFSHTGAIEHNAILNGSDAVIVETEKGSKYLAIKPLLRDFVLGMPRGATVIYPKDAAMIVGYADLYPGAKVLEAGVGSGALSASVLRAIGNQGYLESYERREDFALIAQANVENFFGAAPKNWVVNVGDVIDVENQGFTHILLDMLEPWIPLPKLSSVMLAGGVLCCYLATTTQLSVFVEKIRELECFTEPEAFETILRPWHLEGLAVRPEHRMIGHTGFLVLTRRMAVDVKPLVKRRRPTTSGAEQN